MLAKELIDRLERLALLDQEIIEALREQLQQSGSRVTPEAVAKLLVDNGQLTRFQATKLIGELRSGEYQDEQEDAPESEAQVDELTFADSEESVEAEEEEPIAEAVPVALAASADDDLPMAQPVDTDDENAGGDLSSIAGGTSARPVRRTKKPDKSIWDSFKVYGYAGIIVMLVLIFSALYFVLGRDSAEDFIKQADKLYNQQSFQPAQEQYTKFLDSYGDDNQYSSLARTRVALSELYRAKAVPNPVRGLEVARNVLPSIAEEQALNDDRDDLAALLTDIAENIAQAADESESTGEKQQLLSDLDEHIDFMDNPLYVSSQMRVTLAGRLNSVKETRARVQREINRNLQLDQAVASMKASLEAKETKDAYDTRFALLRDFPELRDNDRLEELIQRASDIQQTLVGPSSRLPKTDPTADESDSMRSIALTTLVGDSIVSLRDEIVYVGAAASVLAFSAEDGRLLWRKYVGSTNTHPPLRIGAGQSVLLTNGVRNDLSRCDGQTGDVQWRSSLGEPFSQPVMTRGATFVSGESGVVYSLDLETGDAMWSTQIPQPLETSPGVDDRADMAYLPGNHSNLYLLNTRDGKCVESYYIGHREGTIQVPPVPLLGHLFVFENYATDATKVHVLRLDDEGKNLTPVQVFQLNGNVIVPPIVQKRRLIVLTDLGEVNVYDVEPTADRDKVSSIAKCSPSYKQPTLTRMAANRSQMWITGTRIARFQLQINTGTVVRDWVKHDGDAFVGQPIALDDALIHARVLRGTSGIRVTAASPETGDMVWQTDVGVPIAMLQRVPGKAAFHAITSQGALFELDRAALAEGSTKAPLENPGGEGVAMRFVDPIIAASAGQETPNRILINSQEPSEILVYDPSRQRDMLRKVTIRLPGRAKTAGQPIVAGGGLLIPLDTGRAVLMRWQTGATLGSPFQPSVDPTGVVSWSDPVPLADDPDQVVLSDSLGRLYRLRVGQQMRELSQTQIDKPLLGPATRVGTTMVATTAGPAADFLVGYDMTGLELQFESLLDGRVVWGPTAAPQDDSGALLRTDDGQLRVFDEAGQQKFAVDLPAGRLVGPPTAVSDDQWLFTGRDGWMVTVDRNTGQRIAEKNLGQPISAQPVTVGDNRFLVPGEEGVVYITEF
ncbi:PQQ-binding-like beta-propeller repeat protein [Crateriforma conspicua]|uniref:Outer membrane biogenesis protein BamB n=1 Tax=Crateriforma conspicua TaxID=2527996 RepID=A0A5C6FQD1_9PLAN|nr:PQQ-binding-like beta-propeller repeat protein [Crateriforma conspicua]TWU65089.1 outer membrane biogenesis protein BamB [Crateriforma conspicua]